MSERAILLDAQLLVLLLVGLTSKDLISKHRRLTAYSESDFDLLESIVRSARQIIVNSNVFTEASNLSRQIAEPHRSKIGETFRIVAQRTEERHISTCDAVNSETFLVLGLTDAAILESAAEATLLTADLDLHIAAARKGLNAVNFNHIRDQP